MSIIKELKKNKKLTFLLFIILALGLFLRLNDFNEEGFWNDDITTIPTALKFFYPHEEYPGLLGQGEPALGNFIIGCGCMLSGEDFSNVTQVPKNFFVGRDALLGKAITNSTPYCHLPMYIFGILFLIIITIFSLSILKLRPTLYIASFVSFFPFLLKYSRWIHVEIILYVFAVTGLFFLWLGFKIKKESKWELTYFIIAFFFFALSFATKLPAALLSIFGGIIIIQKYWQETLIIIKKLTKNLELKLNFIKINEENNHLKHFIKIIIITPIIFLLSLLPPFEFKFSNIFAVIKQYRTTSIDFGGFGFSTNFLISLKEFIYKINTLDTLLLICGILIFFKILKQKNKTKNEKFLITFFIFTFISVPFSTAFGLFRVLFIFLIPLIFLMALTLSKKYLFTNLKNRDLIIIIFIIIYVLFQFSSSLSSSPYFRSSNELICKIHKDQLLCNPDMQKGIFTNNIKYDFLKENLNENETYFTDDPTLYYYIRQGQSIPHYLLREAFRKQNGRNPTIEEYLKILQPYERNIRYVLLFKYQQDPDFKSFIQKYQPNEKLKMNDKELIYVYDTKNLLTNI